MSKIGKKEILIPEGVSVSVVDGKKIEFKGKNANLSTAILSGISASVDGSKLVFVAKGDDKQTMANWGTTRALAQNAISGLTTGFEKVLEIEGIGFKVASEGKDLVLNLGFSHPVKFIIPEGATATVEKNTIKIVGASKELVGQVAAKIRSLKKPEPYKGKGIRYKGEVIRRKAGKKVAGSAK